MAVLHPVTVFVTGILVAVAVSLHQLELVSAMYYCPPGSKTLDTMQPCMPSVEGPYPDPPDDSCCYVVRTTEPGCMCMAFWGYKNSRSINFKAALNLPHMCGRAVPVNFTCNVSAHMVVPVSYLTFSPNFKPADRKTLIRFNAEGVPQFTQTDGAPKWSWDVVPYEMLSWITLIFWMAVMVFVFMNPTGEVLHSWCKV